MEEKPLHKIVNSSFLTRLKAYSISLISLLVLLIAFLSWEQFADIFDLILIFLLFFNVDFIMPYTRIKTPWRIRLLGAIIVEFIAFMLYLRISEISSIAKLQININPLIGILFFITIYGFLIESWRMLPNIIDWSGNSKLAKSYKKSVSKALKKDPSISSKYYYALWGKKILSFQQDEQLTAITWASASGLFLYIVAGLVVAYFTFSTVGLFSVFIESKFSRFIILFIIVIIDTLNSYNEKQYKKLGKESPLEDEPYLNFVNSVFRCKAPYFYLTLTFLNFVTSFAVIFITCERIINFLVSAYFWQCTYYRFC